MKASKLFGFLLFASVALVLTPVSGVVAMDDFHIDGAGREDPWNNCTSCHGPDLDGGFTGVSCFDCHSDFLSPDPPSTGHHMPGREDALDNCITCHGADLTGDIGPSCFSCHGELWNTGGGGGNTPPNVDAGGPYSGAVGELIQFDGSGTFDADGDSMIYLWTFGDGTPPQFPSQFPTTSHAYQAAGLYTAMLSVTDGVNTPEIVTVLVEIGTSSNSPPTADAGGPYSGNAGAAVQFSAAGSFDPEGDTLTYSWDFGDGGSPTSPSQNATATHTYQSGGTFTAVVSVDDGVNGPVTASATVDIVVVNLPPDVDAGGPYSGTTGQAIQFDASGTFDLEGDTLSYMWDFGDGSLPTFPGSDPTTSHIYQNAGTYTAVLTVTDGVNTPVFVDVAVEAEDPGGGGNDPPAAESGDWVVDIPFLFDRISVNFEEFAGILLVHTTLQNGSTHFGIGMEFDGLIFWMDLTGALYLGDVDHDAGTMTGIVFGHPGGSSVWFAERQQ